MAKQKMDYQDSGTAKMAKMKAEAKLEGEPVDEESKEHLQPGGDTEYTGETLKGEHSPAVSIPAAHIDTLQGVHDRSHGAMHPHDASHLQNHIHMLRGAMGGGRHAKVKMGGY